MAYQAERLTRNASYEAKFGALNQSMRWEVAEELARVNLPRVNEFHTVVSPRTSFYTRVGKRFIDVIAAGLMLIVTSPILVVVCLVTCLNLGRPILFRQRRLGRDGREFVMLKIRTMRDAYDDEGRPLLGAQRLTRVGRVLRRTSLDELPNLLNVLRGEMSIIGPRPLVPEYLGRFSNRHRQRLLVRPGLQCPAIRGKGEVSTYQDQFENDCWYVENISLMTDLRMMWQVLWDVFDRRQNRIRAESARGSFTGYDHHGDVVTTANLPQWALDRVLERHGLLETDPEG